MKNSIAIILMTLLVALPSWASAQGEPAADPGDNPLVDDQVDAEPPVDTTQPDEPVDAPLPDGVGAGPGEDDGGDQEAGLTAEAAVESPGGTTIGLGVSSTLAGAVGGEAEFWVGDKLLITALVGINSFSPDADGADSTTTIVIAGGGFYRLAGGDKTDFMVGGRLDLGLATGGQSSNQINLEVPARVEYRFTDSMSIHFETGLVLGLISEDGAVTAPFGPADSRVIQLGGGLFGSAGITLYVL
jgi:hypothetical protein